MQAEHKLSLPSLEKEDADPLARDRMAEAENNLGFIPNMYKYMANSPGLLDTYLKGYAHFRESSGFSPAEQEVVFLTISRENGCNYCVGAHSFIADKMSDVPTQVTDAIRDGQPIDDPKLSALHQFTRVLVKSPIPHPSGQSVLTTKMGSVRRFFKGRLPYKKRGPRTPLPINLSSRTM